MSLSSRFSNNFGKQNSIGWHSTVAEMKIKCKLKWNFYGFLGAERAGKWLEFLFPFDYG